MMRPRRQALAQRKWQDIESPLSSITELLVQLRSEDDSRARATLLSQIEALADDLQETFMSLDFEDVDDLNASRGDNFATVESAEEYLYSVCELVQNLRKVDTTPSTSINYFLHSCGIPLAGVAAGPLRGSTN